MGSSAQASGSLFTAPWPGTFPTLAGARSTVARYMGGVIWSLAKEDTSLASRLWCRSQRPVRATPRSSSPKKRRRRDSTGAVTLRRTLACTTCSRKVRQRERVCGSDIRHDDSSSHPPLAVFDQQIHYWRWTGNATHEALLYPSLSMHAEWAGDCFDADSNGLYQSYSASAV